MTGLLAFIVSNTRAFIAVDLCTSASFPSLAHACRPDIFIFTSDFVRSHVRPSSDLRQTFRGALSLCFKARLCAKIHAIEGFAKPRFSK